MERYTCFENGKWRLRVGKTEHSGPWVDRLAAYEDTGLEPEEIITGEELAEIACALAQNLKYSAIGPVEELSALVKARDEGRVVVLQCKVGDTVYALDEKNSTVREMLISVARILEDGTIAFQAECKDEEEGCFCNSFCAVRFGDRNMVDRKVFLTRAEAEAAIGGGGDG